MGRYDHIGLTLDESLSGWVGVGKTDPVEGKHDGQVQGTAIEMRSHITIDSLTRFLEQPDHASKLDGTITFGPLGVDMQMLGGIFNVFVVDPRTGERRMVYETKFVSSLGKTYFLRGVKHIHDDPGFDVLDDMTTLFTTIYEGVDDQGPVFGAGQLRFKLLNAPAMLASMKVTGNPHFGQALGAKVAFLSFCYGALRDTYLADVNPLYDASYQNVVLSGSVVDAAGATQPFFLVTGIHTKDFPWGDGESFGDVLLVVGDPAGAPRTYAMTDRRLMNHAVDIKAGTIDYDGPIYDVTGLASVSFDELHDPHCTIPSGAIKIHATFRPIVHPLAAFPFRINSSVLDRLAYQVRETLRRLLPSEHLFGFQIVPSTVTQVTGSIDLAMGGPPQHLSVVTGATTGEAEDTTIHNIREPTLLYGYICAIRRAAGAARVQFHTSSLRNEREYWGKDRVDSLFGAAVSRFASRQLDIGPGGVTVTNLAEPPDSGHPHKLFERVGAPIIDVRNDHFPTAVFHRRVIRVLDPSGEVCLGLEEAMDTLRREPIDSAHKATVAAIRADRKLDALSDALDKSDFWGTIDRARAASGKQPSDFAVVIKPNFMFAYNKHDHSTYTDPELVEALVDALYAKGYTNIAVVEAQSTYGEYFYNRGVVDVATYLGYAKSSPKYKLVDLTLDAQEMRHFGPALGFHPVPLTWRDADFRISFAKNKTHCYAFYTLTIKNVYGALALGNKYKEYHCDRDIYATTVEYLQAFPVHFGIIDAWLSADGPFGIFADSEPNPTHTIIAGADLVAVDWVGASKMGIDPKISRYMKEALKAFGKPELTVTGDPTLYHPWLNVPMALSMLANFGLDANHYFGNLFYMSAAYMDSVQFPFKPESGLIRAVRSALVPLQQVIYLAPDGHRSRANRAFAKVLRWLAQ